MIVVGKKLNMKKNLAKLLSLLLIQKILPCFWWRIALNLEDLQKNKNFDLDLIFLHIIKKTNFIENFFQNYFIFKIKSLDKTLCIMKKDKFFHCSCFLKIKYFQKILLIIGFNLIKSKPSYLLKLILNSTGKSLWISPHLSFSLEELINFSIFQPKISSQIIELVKIVTLPKFPVLHSFWLFSILRECLFNFRVFSNHNRIKSIVGGIKKNSKKKFCSNLSSLSFFSNDFFLYQ